MRFPGLRRHRGANGFAGNIVAMPNPAPPASGSPVVISWTSDDPKGVEIRVSTAGGPEQVITRAGQTGDLEVGWIKRGKKYDFRLYTLSKPNSRLASVKVRRQLGSWRKVLADFATQVADGDIEIAEAAEAIGQAIVECLRPAHLRRVFTLWERLGFHVTPVHFYEPIPIVAALPENIWERTSQLPGIDMNDATQLRLLCEEFPKFRGEYEQFPTQAPAEPHRFYLDNGLFDGIDALLTYCVLRHFQPQLVIEIGSGFSSLLTAEAVARGNCTELICIEPFPREFLRDDFPGLRALIEKPVQELDLAFFSQLKDGDILFIDSSHTVKIGSDVNYLFLEVLPRLNPGVIVHVHDIFFPNDYRRDWVMEQLRFWNEQYLLQAFLSFNSEFEVLLGSSYLAQYHHNELTTTFPHLPQWGGGSFWMRRRSAGDSTMTSSSTI